MKLINFSTTFFAAVICASTLRAFADDMNMSMTNAMSATNSMAAPVLTPAGFAWDAAIINLKEIRLGEAAQNNSQNPAVQKFGKHMVRDHKKMFEHLAKIASAEGIQLPETNTFYVVVTPPQENEKEATELMPENPQEILLKAQLDVQSLTSLSGPAFDQAYADAMVKGHEKAIQKFENASALQDDRLKEYADKGLTIIRHHLEMAQELQNKVMQSTNSPATAPGNNMNGMPVN
jgi:putative membrane protein